jgi:dihydrofolate synthase/folylpolyglutamate synthase
MQLSTLSGWLAYQETLNKNVIDLGLERVQAVLQRLLPNQRWPAIVTVAGTNGKGSCVALLSEILVRGGYRVGAYTSPHIFRYNERVTLNGVPVNDAMLCDAFAHVERARQEAALTYFEFGTLAALYIFAQSDLQVVLLEVGLGGRLDAVNVLDADVALITNIAIDHVQWLGPDREAIAREKAGVMRRDKPVVCTDEEPPVALRSEINRIGAQAYFIRQHFRYVRREAVWDWECDKQIFTDLPLPALFGEHQLRNAAGVLMVLQLLSSKLPLHTNAVRQGLVSVRLPGRFQEIPVRLPCGVIPHVFDVAHNQDAAIKLAAALKVYPVQGRTVAVVGMLADKAIADVLRAMLGTVDIWCIGGLAVPRAAEAKHLSESLPASAVVYCFDSVKQAYKSAKTLAEPNDRIVVFGSFHTVEAILPEATDCDVQGMGV